MLKKIIIILLVPICLAFGENNNLGMLAKIPSSEHRIRPGVAPIISFFIPGGGHFYLDEYKTGVLYASTRLLLIPGLRLFMDNFPVFNDNVNQTELGISYGLIFVGITSWTLDIIHAGISAHNYNLIYEDNKGSLGYQIRPDFENRGIKLSFNYELK